MRQQSLYILKGCTCTSESAYIVQGSSHLLDPEEPLIALATSTYTSKAPMEVWHHRLAHISPEYVKKLLAKDMARGMEVLKRETCETGPCKACLEGKHSHKPIPDESEVENP